MTAFFLEIKKGRRKRLWLICPAMVAVQGLWLLWAIGKANGEIITQGYRQCFYQFPLLNAIVLPVMIAMLCSRLCDMEHKGRAYKTLFTMEQPGALFDAKLGLIALCLLGAVGMQLGVIWLVGSQRGFLDMPSPEQWGWFLLSQWMTSMFVAVVCQWLALSKPNQFLCLLAGLMLGFLGLMAMFFPPAIMGVVPSAYYGLLSAVQMDWNPVSRIATYDWSPAAFRELGLLTAATVAAFKLCRRHFIKQEV